MSAPLSLYRFAIVTPHDTEETLCLVIAENDTEAMALGFATIGDAKARELTAPTENGVDDDDRPFFTCEPLDHTGDWAKEADLDEFSPDASKRMLNQAILARGKAVPDEPWTRLVPLLAALSGIPFAPREG